MSEEKNITFTLTQSEMIGNIQNRLYVELCREQHIFLDKTEYYVQLKAVTSNKMVTEKFSLEEAEKISEAILYVSVNESTFPTQGSTKIEFKIDERIKIQILRRQNGWEFLLSAAKAVYKIQYAELQKLQELVFAAINSAQTSLP